MTPEQASEAATHNRATLAQSAVAACFYCEQTFDPRRIIEWCDGGETAICPRCGIDSVVGEASGAPVHDRAWLRRTHEAWFSSPGIRLDGLAE